MKEPRIGVYICHCGGNISDTVDVAKVKEDITKCNGVKVCQTYEYMCDPQGFRGSTIQNIQLRWTV